MSCFALAQHPGSHSDQLVASDASLSRSMTWAGAFSEENSQERAHTTGNGVGPYTLLTLCRLARGITVAVRQRTFSLRCASLFPPSRRDMSRVQATTMKQILIDSIIPQAKRKVKRFCDEIAIPSVIKNTETVGFILLVYGPPALIRLEALPQISRRGERDERTIDRIRPQYYGR
jgi:hypothetical protein